MSRSEDALKRCVTEALDGLRECLPDEFTATDDALEEWLGDSERFRALGDEPDDSSENAALWFGYLQGAADALDVTIVELIQTYQIEPCSPGCPGWGHFNVGDGFREEIERCDDCGRFETDEDAAQAHAKHCNCGMDAGDVPAKRCHYCRGPIDTTKAIDANHRLFCSPKCHVECGP